MLSPSAKPRKLKRCTVSAGGASSSSTIVPRTVRVANSAFVAPLNARTTVSSSSSASSPRTFTHTVFNVSPGSNVSVPLSIAA